jgi:photosystem II stability/assembly factor-like uncharacterized protein
MANDLGTGVSYVYDDQGYNYDMLVYQKGKPPLDSELNLSQELSNELRSRQMMAWPSGWISYYPVHIDRSLSNSFYTQNPVGAKPEFAVVNGHVIHVTNTATQEENANLIELGNPPSTGNIVEGIILEVWRALISPNSVANKPDTATVIDSLNCIFMYDNNNGWICGDNGLLLGTQNGGQTWSVLLIDTKRKLNGIYYATQAIGWVVGDNGIIARTTSSGARWTNLTTGISENLLSIHAASQLIAWAVGSSGTILKTTNGVTWLPLISGVTSDLRKVHFYDQLVGWVVGADGIILKTTNGGSSWVRQTSGTAEALNSVYFYDLNFGFAVGDNGTILRTSDGGSSWVSQSGNIFTGSGYVTTSEHLKDVTMVPTLDRLVTDEEVSSQLGPAGTSFTVANTPITKGDGNGTVTNDPRDVKVTVNGTEVLVNSVNGTTGAVLLNAPPGNNAVVKVTYFYNESCAVFQGKAWIVGTNGSILFTQDIGAQWVQQNSGTAYDILSADFINQTTGWVAGANSIIKNTTNSGSTWSTQQSDQFVREVQRIFFEGNIKSKTYLADNSIHPDANIETTRRVQIQYKIRVISGADPGSNPEAGLSTGIMGEGPNVTGIYAYQNMGSINGDYGCWRAKCSNTVDGYVYAIPMYFVNRRNTSTYDPQTNPNGSHQKNTAFIRPDLLIATNVVESDILDVRRRIVIPSIQKLMTAHYDELMANILKTNFFRSSEGGDRYGIELLQVDRVGGTTANGGKLISYITLADVMADGLSSEVSIETELMDVPASSTVPLQQILGPVLGIFHPQETHYKVTYQASETSPYFGKPVPGYFSGHGTDRVTFVFDESAITTLEEPTLTAYRISADWISPKSTALTYVPSEPKLVKNFSGQGSAGFFYQGVSDTDEYRVIETWSSGIPNLRNYAIAYRVNSATDTEQYYKASSVEVHYFTKVSASGSTLTIPLTVYPDAQDVPYSIYSVRRIKNITSGFSHRILNIEIQSSQIIVTAVPGFEFISGSTVEIIAGALSSLGDTNVRNGATVNFNPFLKKISKFSKSITVTTTPSFPITVTVANAEILGCSTTETAQSLNQFIYWRDSGAGAIMQTVSVTGFGTDTITIDDSAFTPGDIITIQLLVKENLLTYMQDTTVNDGLMISYNYIPPQCQANLPESLTVEAVIVPPVMYISNLGSGGGVQGVPYLTPLQHIPVNDSSIDGDSIFNNKDPMHFSNVTIDTGYVQMPIYIPGSFSGNITLSEPTLDKVSRPFYSKVSKEISFTCEGLQVSAPRKIFIPMIARIEDKLNRIYMHGEYVLLIFSRSAFSDRENKGGYFSGGNCSVSVYRIPNRPISRIS